MDHLLSHDVSYAVNFSSIPTTADPSELGGFVESGELEQLEELLDEGYDVSAVLSSMSGSESTSTSLSSAPQVSTTVKDRPVPEYEGGAYRKGTRRVISESERRQRRSASSLSTSIDTSPSAYECPPSPSKFDSFVRFDPDVHRSSKATAHEIISAVDNQDFSTLRAILMEKSWPDHRSIGHHLDKIFELVIRDCQDTDEAMLFFRDFAASNRRAFLHDVNGIRLACRVACDSGSVDAAMDALRIFRNMFLVRSRESITDAGSVGEVERLHRLMVDQGFDRDSEIFVRASTQSMLKTWSVRCNLNKNEMFKPLNYLNIFSLIFYDQYLYLKFQSATSDAL
ncbi:unnamed protein product [Strongylus vulgaris]|uniref:Uncharacterized protein n=1 Tax=Strongylus vulgaris TaxID=40348 RepID=A0A3P7KH57_STRVU|nr:unnamed protein product [Strongylus vulgaris]